MVSLIITYDAFGKAGYQWSITCKYGVTNNILFLNVLLILFSLMFIWLLLKVVKPQLEATIFG